MVGVEVEVPAIDGLGRFPTIGLLVDDLHGVDDAFAGRTGWPQVSQIVCCIGPRGGGGVSCFFSRKALMTIVGCFTGGDQGRKSPVGRPGGRVVGTPSAA